MTHDEVMRRSIALASAFIANGDIRLGGSTRDDSQAMLMTTDLIRTIYVQLTALDAELSPSNERH